MYETYEQLMERKLGMISDKRDKRQGSLIFDALAPNAVETATFYADLQLLEDRTFADTSIGEDLTRRCAERGVIRKDATKATYYGRFLDGQGLDYPMEIGSRFACGEFFFIITEISGDGRVVLQCETAGEAGNQIFDELLPLDYMEGLATAVLMELRTDGEDEEGDEQLRSRYLQSFLVDAFGGNIADYKRKVMAMQNVGGVKVYPVWNGGGTVRLVIVDQGWRAPTEVELAQLQDAIDPEQQGFGYGVAPIGHKVTVDGVDEVVIRIDVEITKDDSKSHDELLVLLKETIEGYFYELRTAWADSEKLVIRSSQIESRILDITGVIDVENCQLNGQNGNKVLLENEIPVLGEIEVV